MATRKLGKLKGVNIARILKPIGVRIRCEFLTAANGPIEFEMAGDLALALAKEIENFLPSGKKSLSRPRPSSVKPKTRVAK